MADTKRIHVEITGSSRKLQDASKKGTKSLNKMEAAAAKMGGALAGAFGAAVIVQGIGRAIKSIAEFEGTMRRVAIISKGSEKELSKLALTLGKTTVFTANQAGEAMTFLAQAGFKSNEILKATPGVLELAAAAQLDLSRAADIASNVLSAYGLEAKEINRINDILVTTTNNANTNVEQFAEAFKIVGPIAKGAGVSINEVSSLIGVLGDAGIQGSLAGTQLKVAISTLISPSDKAADRLAKLGVATKNADGEMRNLTDIFADLRDANLSAEDAFEIFEQRAASGALVMSGAADKARDLAEQTEKVGEAAFQSKRQLDTLSGSIKLLGSAWDGLIMEGGALSDIFRGTVILLTDLLNGFIGVTRQGDKFVSQGKEIAEHFAKINAEAKKNAEILEIVNTAMASPDIEEYKKSLDTLLFLTGSLATKDEILNGIKKRQNEILAEELLILNASKVAWQEYTEFKNRAIEAEMVHGEAIKENTGLIGEMGETITSHNKIMEGLVAWQKLSKENIDKATAAYKNQQDVLQQGLLVAINSITFALSAQGGAWKALGNVILATAQQIINAMLAESIAKMIAGEAHKGLFGLATAAIGIAAITSMFNSIPAFATGTNFAPGGMALVGERGPEVVNIPQGSKITPNHMIGGMGGGTNVVVNGFVGNEFELARQINIVLQNQGSKVARTTF